MKLTQALSRRKTLADEIEKLSRDISSELYDFKKKTKQLAKDNPVDLLKKYDAKVEEYEKLVAKINRINEESIVDNERLADLLVKRDITVKAVVRARGFAESAVVSRSTTATEIRMVPSIRSSELYKSYEPLRKRQCDLEIKIQSANWSIEVSEDDESAEETTDKLAELKV